MADTNYLVEMLALETDKTGFKRTLEKALYETFAFLLESMMSPELL